MSEPSARVASWKASRMVRKGGLALDKVSDQAEIYRLVTIAIRETRAIRRKVELSPRIALTRYIAPPAWSPDARCSPMVGG
jgi:hypothetical protein